MAANGRNTPKSIHSNESRKPLEKQRFLAKNALEPIGLEPTTSWLQTRRSPD